DWGGSGLAVGGDAGLLLFRLTRVRFYLIFLALLATVRGGTSFLFPTAKKKRSKENASQPPILKCPERALTTVWYFRRTVTTITTNS
ncbi:hypothetical protein, partial [Caballeronia sordidicola]|uniref:hypothetical protein n=1 Tax=Caballeronia sordidicola TaxID=196367 RepID=UPI001C4F4263